MKRLSGLLIVLFLFLPARAGACSIPVFRFALERWRPSNYEAVVFHKGALSDAEKGILQKLEDANPPANLLVTVVDLAGKVDPELQKLWSAQGKPTLPHVVVRYPHTGENMLPAWAGPLQTIPLTSLLDSPTRRQIAKLLTKGESAVILLLESGDVDADKKVAELLQKELTALAPMIVLPEPNPDGPQLLAELPLKVSFSVVKLARNAVGEEAFIRQLLGTDADLEKEKGPIAFPIFGRGRVLCGFRGKDLNAQELEGACTFLCRACSCEVKEQNPGVDLLSAIDWDEMVNTSPVKETVPEVKPLPKPTIPSGKVSPPQPLPEAVPAPTPTRTWIWLAVGVVGLLVVGSGTWAFRSGRVKE